MPTTKHFSDITTYISSVESIWKSGSATEHSYRLKTSALMAKL